MNLQVSVIIPVFNGEAYLAEAIDSVLSQTYPTCEILVVDDGSTDTSAAVARSFAPAVRTLTRPNGGVGAARNDGIEASTGDTLAFLDADDLWTPDKLAVQVAALEHQPSLDMVFGHVEQFLSLELDDEARARYKVDPRPGPGYITGSMMVRRASFERVGPFATQWVVGEFIEWYGRARDLGLTGELLESTVLRRRVHGTNTGVVRREARSDFVRVVKAALDRRRAARNEPE